MHGDKEIVQVAGQVRKQGLERTVAKGEDVRENTGQWKWVEDKLLISVWLNVSIDPLVGTDQKAEAFWSRIQQYCEDESPGVIKRGVMAIKKRWQRINKGAQKFGAAYDQAQRTAGSGTNMDNLVEKARDYHLTNFKKKSNFELQCELRRHPKWRPPPTSASSKRTKLSSSGAYSSEGNNDTPTSEEFELVRPQGTKVATSRKGKGKGKATAAEVAEYESIQVNGKKLAVGSLCLFLVVCKLVVGG
ncbi:glutathione S-transferase T3-like [Apium graveolens]|uniref:glutathione S-transferase T3-like n=1 Tax=Apium graveolens TaxID=4045 RepID=UPI003D7BC382